MGASITLAGQSLIAQKQADQQALNVASFVFANVPGLNPSAPVDRSCLLYTSPSPRDRQKSRMPSSA